jgi:type I restriction enzyme, S subunit
MSTTLLFEHFATLATAPDGITRLRELILQLAVQGKLGTQDAGDEPASELLEKIRKEIRILVNKGSVKPDKPFELINDDNLPFEIPQQWKWVRLGEIAIVTDRDHRTPVYHSSGVPLISPNVFTKDGIDFRNPKYVDEEELRLFKRKCNPQKGDILYSRIGAIIGEARLVNFDKDYVALHSLASIKPIRPFVSSEFLCKILSSNFLKTQGYDGVKSVGVPDLGLNKMKNFLIPLPPLAEQHRIVAKVDRLMALCNELEARQQQERAGCLKLGTASLAGLQNAESPEEFGRQWAQVCDAFDLILDCPENVKVFRQTILQLAVQGKLGTHNVKDEPASVLLKKMQNEKEQLIVTGKIRRDKPMEPLGEVPYELPKGWIWTRLNDVSSLITDGTHVTPAYISSGIPFLSVNNLKNNVISFLGCKFISKSVHSELTKRCKPEKMDIILGKVGSIGVCDVIDTDKEFSIFVQLALIKPIHPFVNSFFVNKAIQSKLFQDQMIVESAGSALQYIGVGKIKSLVLPLPPLAEQHRIVAKVDTLMALCDALESRLKERAGLQGRLAGAVVKQVAGGV